MREQSKLKLPIVSISSPMTLLGGADLGMDELNISLNIAPTIVAADGGVDHAIAQNVDVAAVIGDLDSLSDTASEMYESVIHRIHDEDTTDFEKVLSLVDAPYFIGCGFLGGRLDHTMSVVNVLARFPHKQVVLLSADDAVFLAPPEVDLKLPIGTRIGILPLGDVNVRSTGLRWELAEKPLHPAGTVSSSNENAAERVQLSVDGPLIITLPLAQVQTAINAVRAE